MKALVSYVVGLKSGGQLSGHGVYEYGKRLTSEFVGEVATSIRSDIKNGALIHPPELHGEIVITSITRLDD